MSLAPSATDRQLRLQMSLFGFVVARGLVRSRMSEIEAAFEEVMAAAAPDNGYRRVTVPSFVSRDPRLDQLLHDEFLARILTCVLAPGYRYVGGDGCCFIGDTLWHQDGINPQGLFVKCALYLDPLDARTGALRVLPGSHRPDFSRRGRTLALEPGQYGMDGRDIPSHVVETNPGDVVLFDTNIMHSAWNGEVRRRQISMVFSRAVRSPAEAAAVRRYILAEKSIL